MIARFVPPSGGPIVTTVLEKEDFNLLSEEIADWLLLDSGTSALALALLDARERFGDRAHSEHEVIVPAYCCPQILAAVRYAGLTPVLVDLERDTPWLDLQRLRAAVTPATVALIAINFCGVSERISEIRSIGTDHQLGVVYDACQTFPKTADDLTAADYMILSFGRGKPVSILGGGALVVPAGLGRRAKSCLASASVSAAGPLRLRLALPVYDLARHPIVFPMLEALGLSGGTRYVQLGEIRRLNPMLRPQLCANISRYREAKHDAAHGIARIIADTNVPLIDLGSLSGAGENARFWRYPVLAPDEDMRNRLIQRLRRFGIGASPLYGAVLPEVRGAPLDASADAYPAGQDFAKRLLTLPSHAGVTAGHLRRIAEVFETMAA